MSRHPLDSCEKEKINEVKRQICQRIRRIAFRYGWTQRELAFHLSVSQSTASRVVRLRVEQLTLNQLFAYLARLCPQLEILIGI